MSGVETRYVLVCVDIKRLLRDKPGAQVKLAYPVGKYTTAGDVVDESQPRLQRAPAEMAALSVASFLTRFDDLLVAEGWGERARFLEVLVFGGIAHAVG